MKIFNAPFLIAQQTPIKTNFHDLNQAETNISNDTNITKTHEMTYLTARGKC